MSSLWGGWVTDERMKVLVAQSGRQCRCCVLRCGFDKDMVEHYGRCSMYWSFVSKPRTSGLGIDRALRSAEAFLSIANGMHEHDKIRMAIGMYALYRTVQTLRHTPPDIRLDPHSLMKLWVHRAAQRSKAATLLMP